MRGFLRYWTARGRNKSLAQGILLRAVVWVVTSFVVGAVDLGPTSPRVLLHAAGFAAALGAGLKVLHVAANITADTQATVAAECLRMAPYQAMFEESDVLVRLGPAAETIQEEVRQHHTALLVIGSSGYGRFARLVMGSTSDALLQTTQTPTLLVPPNDLDIINSVDGFKLTCGPVLVAIDLSEDSRPQLEAASRMALLAGQGLLVMTVASGPVSDHDAAEQLRDRAHGLAPIKPTALIVRRGNVAEEISRCAVAEDSGLVVLGLREPARGRPGVIASAVLHTGRAFVLAVPAG